MAKIADLYGGGVTGELMSSRFRDGYGRPKQKVAKIVQRRHMTARDRVGPDGVYRYGRHEWKVPVGLLYYWHRPIRRHQVVVFHPWWATWLSPKTGHRLKKQFESLPQAIHFVATRAQYADPRAGVTSKLPYDIIPALRGKLPRTHNGTRYYWCPCCVTARRFYAVYPEQTFYTLKKVWSDDKQRYIPTERKIRVIHCAVCGITNRDGTYRRSNQPWETRRFKQGVRRAKRRR